LNAGGPNYGRRIDLVGSSKPTRKYTSCECLSKRCKQANPKEQRTKDFFVLSHHNQQQFFSRTTDEGKRVEEVDVVGFRRKE
jgi:hypothetical protein